MTLFIRKFKNLILLLCYEAGAAHKGVASCVLYQHNWDMGSFNDTDKGHVSYCRKIFRIPRREEKKQVKWN